MRRLVKGSCWAMILMAGCGSEPAAEHLYVDSSTQDITPETAPNDAGSQSFDVRASDVRAADDVNSEDAASTMHVVDTGTFRDNQTIGPFTEPENGYDVYIVDRGNFATAPPSCVNGRNPYLDCSGDYTRGARTTDVYAVRSKTLEEYSTARLRAFPLPYGGGQVAPSRFDFVLSSFPGKMESDFEGSCAVRNNTDGRISLVTQAVFDESPMLQSVRCVVPEDQLFYVNIRALAEICDTPGANCNSYIYPAGLR